MKRISGYVVMQGHSYTALNKGVGGVVGGGVLLPSPQATLFNSRKKARRAVMRTYRMSVKLAPHLNNSILDEWSPIRSLLSITKGCLTVVPLNLQGAPYAPKVRRPHQLDVSTLR